MDISPPAEYATVITTNRFEGGAFAEIRLYPVELGAARHGTTTAIENNDGVIPLQATRDRAQPPVAQAFGDRF